MWPFKKSIEQLSIDLAGKVAARDVLLQIGKETKEYYVRNIVELSLDIGEISTKIKFMQLNEKQKEKQND